MTEGTQPRSVKGSTILVVEDDYFIADELRNGFEERGGQVLGPVPTVEAALKIIEATPDLDAATLDVALGEGNAFAVADVLIEKDIPFVFLTGYSGWVIPERYDMTERHKKPARIQEVVNSLFDDET
ncbi:response regulator [Amaricoccus macauensis]|uniref:response regulator n=1 Tax=Amaricoccus macauensis TaxID=57001 RepID=UPI003C7CF782